MSIDNERWEDHQNELRTIRVNHYYELARRSADGALNFSALGLRSIILANGGALVALLTLIGSMGPGSASVIGLWNAFGIFSLGLTAGLFAILFSYLNQIELTDHVEAIANKFFFSVFSDTDSMVEADKEASDSGKSSEKWRKAAIATSIVSGLSFFAGTLCGLLHYT